ncbi:unnamed protein product [Durusdinium trenchii]|uniref:Polyketide synthase n=1 Tax=Durusdinium trenchii TaxID=1381693 RepID=A0ABP0I4W9_9DINO
MSSASQLAPHSPRVFLFCGEGAHSAETDIACLKLSRSWPAVEDALQQLGLTNAEAFLLQNLGKHCAPTSPVVSVVLNMLNADLWQQWGEVPSVVVGHSVGEVAAAYAAGIFTAGQAISCAYHLGLAMLEMKGTMLHTEMQRKCLPTEDGFQLAAVNYVIKRGATEEEDLLSVTLCSLGSAEEYLAKDSKATLLKPEHAWHHRVCWQHFIENIPTLDVNVRQIFISAVTGTQLEELSEDHWQRWCNSPVNFEKALEKAKEMLQGTSPVVLEMGPHPVLYQAAKALSSAREKRRGSDPGLLGEVADAPTPSVYCATSAAADANSGSNQPVSTDVGAGATSPAGHVAQPAVSQYYLTPDMRLAFLDLLNKLMPCFLDYLIGLSLRGSWKIYARASLQPLVAGRVLLRPACLTEHQQQLLALKMSTLASCDDVIQSLRPLDRLDSLAKDYEEDYMEEWGEEEEGEDYASEDGDLDFLDFEDRERDEMEAVHDAVVGSQAFAAMVESVEELTSLDLRAVPVKRQATPCAGIGGRAQLPSGHRTVHMFDFDITPWSRSPMVYTDFIIHFNDGNEHVIESQPGWRAGPLPGPGGWSERGGFRWARLVKGLLYMLVTVQNQMALDYLQEKGIMDDYVQKEEFYPNEEKKNAKKTPSKTKGVFVDRWKPTERVGVMAEEYGSDGFEPENHGGLAAKSRWCVVGMEGPSHPQVERAVPTPLTSSVYLTLQLAASRKWKAYSKDAKTAFLQSRPTTRRRMPPDEAFQGYHLEQLILLLTEVYGPRSPICTSSSSAKQRGSNLETLKLSKASFEDLAWTYACSMRRGEKTGHVLRRSRAMLRSNETLRSQLQEMVSEQQLQLHTDFETISFEDQGIGSQHLVSLAQQLEKFFPMLAAYDFYRFNSLEKLIQHWDTVDTDGHIGRSHTATALDILGCGLRLPAGVASPGAFWSLLEKDDQSSAFRSKLPGITAAFLHFDQVAAAVDGVEGAEAAAMDPQHTFALQLAAEMFRDVEIGSPEGPEIVKRLKGTHRERVGVYIGAWQEITPTASTGTSAYQTIGTSLSALAARVANAYDLQGPAMTINTACSSALVAVHEALKDAKIGRIDFAIVGGVNLFGEDLQLFHQLRRAMMLSPSGRCHTFSAEADGYVRGEGGVLFLLAREDLHLPSCGRILGSAVTQNSRRRPLSSVDPFAQEHAIRLACADARLSPSELSAVELHGTGTPLGDPVEVSALARTEGRINSTCWMTAAKMHVGHLESAAGAVGLLKAMLMCQHRRVPAFKIGKLNPQVMAAMEGSCLKLGEEGVLMEDAKVGISSFGFAGSNAHVVITAPEGANRPPYEATEERQSGSGSEAVPKQDVLSQDFAPRCDVSAEDFTRSSESTKNQGDHDEHVDVAMINRLRFVSSAVLSIVGGDGSEVDVDADLHELGLDSLGLAELLGLLEDSVTAGDPLTLSAQDKFGPGCIGVEKIMDQPTCRAIASKLDSVQLETVHLPHLLPVPPVAVPPVVPVKIPVVPVVPKKTIEQHVMSDDDGDDGQWIRTTHVGSLPRPEKSGNPIDLVILQQTEIDLDVINDGEWGRENYISDVINRVSGLNGGDMGPASAASAASAACCNKHAMPLAADMLDVPLYAQRFSGGNGLITLNPKREAVSGLACVAHPKYIAPEIPNLKAFVTAVAAAGKSVLDCFYSVPSPGTMALFCRDLVFNDHKAYVMALADALAEEYQLIAQHGILLQVDCPDLAMGRHTKWSQLSHDDFMDVARCNVEALNRALRNVPIHQIRVHVCWGNYAGPHHQDMPAEHLWSLLGEVKAKYLLLEGANGRHRADVQCFESAVKKGYFKSHQVIVPGLIDTTTARVEDPRLIAEDLLRYIRAAGHPKHVMASTDCGFASTARSTAITADLASREQRETRFGAGKDSSWRNGSMDY